MKKEEYKVLYDGRGVRHTLHKYTLPDGTVLFERLQLKIRLRPTFRHTGLACLSTSTSDNDMLTNSGWTKEEVNNLYPELSLSQERFDEARAKARELIHKEDMYHK